jgi:hypothetical protein
MTVIQIGPPLRPTGQIAGGPLPPPEPVTTHFRWR